MYASFSTNTNKLSSFFHLISCTWPALIWGGNIKVCKRDHECATYENWGTILYALLPTGVAWLVEHWEFFPVVWLHISEFFFRISRLLLS